MGHIVKGEVGSVEGLGKRVLENGGGSESGRRFSENGGHGVPQLKYKKRKFSAVRDFPRGCGPLLINEHSKANGVVLAPPVEDSALVSKEIGSRGLELKQSGAALTEDVASESKENGFVGHPLKLKEKMESSVHETETMMEELKEKMDSSVHETETMMEGLAQAKAPESVSNSDNMIVDTSPVKLQDNLVSDHVPSSVSVDPLAIEESTKKRVYPPRRKISAVRDFPPNCGVSVASVSIELQKSVDSSKDKDKNLVKEKSSEDAQKKQIDKPVVKGGEVKVQDGDASKSKPKEAKENGDGSKGKLQGSGNVLKSKPKEMKETGDTLKSKPTERKETGDALKSKLKESKETEEGVRGKLEGRVKKDLVEQKSSSSKKPNMGTASSAGKVGSDSVKLGKDMNYKRKFPEKSMNGSRAINETQGEESDSLDSSDDRVVVQSLMAKQNCQWSEGKNIKPATRTPSTMERGKKTFKSSSRTPAQQVKQEKTTSKTLSGTPSQRVEQGSNQSQVAEALDSELLEDREIVQSLMAARTCPWRNGKKAYKSPSVSAKKQAFVLR